MYMYIHCMYSYACTCMPQPVHDAFFTIIASVGIPESHPAMLLGIIVRSKDHLVPPKKAAKLSLMEPAIPANSTVDTISASVTLPYSHARRHHSASEEMAPQAKKSRLQLEVGIGDKTPPMVEGSEQKLEQQDHRDSSPSTPEVLPEVSDEAVTASTSVGASTGNVIPGLDFHPNPSTSAEDKKKPAVVASTSSEVGTSQGSVQLSFYGQHQEASTAVTAPSANPTLPTPPRGASRPPPGYSPFSCRSPTTSSRNWRPRCPV